MSHIAIQYQKTPVGELIIGAYNDKLVLCDWRYRKMRPSVDKRIQTGLNAQYVQKEHSIITLTIQQLNEYFDGKRTSFTIPLQLIGTDFQQSVWNSLLKIEHGETNTYLGLSRLLGNEKAIRAVASANGANAISIIIPCHRIIGSDNSLIGYAGGLSAKKKLLQLENCKIFNQTSLF